MVRSIFEDSKGNYWFGSDKEGVCKYDGHTLTYYTENEGLGSNQIRTIQEDQNGNIWFSTSNSITSFDGQNFTIHIQEGDSKKTNKPNFNGKINPNNLWFQAFHQTGVYCFDGQNISYLAFPESMNSVEGQYLVTGITEIVKDNSNIRWFATYSGAIGYDGKSFNVLNEKKYNYHVRAILQDSKGNIWIGNNGSGILIFDGKKVIKFSEKAELSNLFDNAFPHHVFSIAEDDKGNIWIGDRDTGAWCYDGSILKNYRIEDGLKNLFVRVIYKDKKGSLWYGLEGGNVCKFNGKTFDKKF